MTEHATGRYRARDDGNLVNASCSLLLEQLFDDETTDVACAYDGEFLEAGHDMGWCIDEWVSWFSLCSLSVKVVGIYTVS